MNQTYFEGVLQLRDVPEDIMDYIAEEIKKESGVWIAKSKKHKNGIDLYISSNKFLIQIGKKLQQSFPGELTKSNTLFTRNSLTSRDVYRGCILFRYCGLKKGDVITYKGEPVTVISLGKKVFAKNNETNQKLHIKYEDLKR
jgi:NMD protein affecting ribosome stability and mRNA decay